LDEENFFRWLESIPAVTGVARAGRDLDVSLKVPVGESDLRDLIALLKRYGIDMKCLRAFADAGNASWFRSPSAYWHADVFG
jgi:hypothetical protein